MPIPELLFSPDPCRTTAILRSIGIYESSKTTTGPRGYPAKIPFRSKDYKYLRLAVNEPRRPLPRPSHKNLVVFRFCFDRHERLETLLISLRKRIFDSR